MVAFGLYGDQACTSSVSSINWGTLSPGSSENVTVYVRNEGNVPFNLSKSVSWHTANASAYITLSWDYKNQTVPVSGVIKIVLTLAVAANTPASLKSFSFDLTITATDPPGGIASIFLGSLSSAGGGFVFGVLLLLVLMVLVLVFPRRRWEVFGGAVEQAA